MNTRTFPLTFCLAACLARPLTAAPIGQMWPADDLTKVLRTDQPASNVTAALHLSGAREETVSGQAVLRPDEDWPAARATLSALRHRKSGAVIAAEAVRLQWVRYLEITRNTAGLPPDERIASAPTALPDPFWDNTQIPLQAGQAQPIWIEVRVPPEARPGSYDATLQVQGAPGTLELPVTLEVWDFTLPTQRHLAVINWWRFPGTGFEQVESHSPAYYELLGRFCAFLVAHRQTDVNASFADLIRPAEKAGADPSFDTSRLERYAETAFQAGIERIHLHSLGQHTAGLTDPASRVQPNEENFSRLAALEKVIQRRGWRRRFLASIADEPFVHHEESFAALVDRAHATAPSVRCIEAVETEYLGKLDVYVPKLSHLNLWYPRFDEVRREGAELWFYTCCHPVGRYPNRFLDQSLLKVRVLHWLNYLYDLDGYLHWGLNHFHGPNPYTEEGVSQGLPLGDRAIVYPAKLGLVGSLRFSAQRDGLEDYEYLRLLEDQLARLKERVGPDAFWLDPRQRPLELCRRVIWSFHDYTRDPDRLLATRRTVAEEIEALSAELLLFVQTSPPEGTVVPAGPRCVIVRGLAAPGARVTLDGAPIPNIRPSGYFYAAHFLSDANPAIRVTAEQEGKTKTAQRTFTLTD